MPDKMRTGFPIAVSFTDGEIPDSRKLEGLSKQTRSGLTLLENVIGDPWNQAGDSLLIAGGNTLNALMIPNLARYIGAAQQLNITLPYDIQATRYTHKVQVSDAGKYEFELTLPVQPGSAFTWTGTAVPTTEVASKGLVVTTGDFYVNKDIGRVYTYDPAQADWTVTYEPSSTTSTDSNTTARFNVIPDPDTPNAWSYLGCKIAYANNVDNTEGYIIFFPPRGPLNTRVFTRSPQSRFSAPVNALNESPDPANLPIYVWQDPTLDATVGTYASNYRYNLPHALTDYWAAASAIPSGFLLLWDHSQTGTVIDGLTFTAENATPPKTWAIVASGNSLDAWVANYMDTAYAVCGGQAALVERDNHSVLYYPSTGLRIVTVGISISEFLWALTKRVFNHDHSSGLQFPDVCVKHESLMGNFDPGQVPAGMSQFRYTDFEQDDHPQYLHRAGTAAAPILNRDPYLNGMMGDLLFLSADSTNNHKNLLAESCGVIFGDATIGGKVDFGFQVDSVVDPSVTYLLTGLRLKSAPEGNFIFQTDGIPPNLVLYNQGPAGDPPDAIGHVTLTDYGEITIEDPWNYSKGLRYGGAINCNRHYKAEWDESGARIQNFNAGVYGDSGGDYGPIQYYTLMPSDFLNFNVAPAALGGVAVTATHPTEMILAQMDGAGLPQAFVVNQNRAAVNLMYSLAFINLPFPQYCIVNAMATFAPIGANLTATVAYVAMGFMQYQALLGAGQYPEGYTVPTAAPVVRDLRDAAGGDVADGDWVRPMLFAASTSPLIEVSNAATTISTAPGRMPWIRFHTTPDVGAVPDLYLGPVTIYYRVREI